MAHSKFYVSIATYLMWVNWSWVLTILFVTIIMKCVYAHTMKIKHEVNQLMSVPLSNILILLIVTTRIITKC